MDTRAARRAAEKAARDLITSRTALIGELGVAQAERTQLDDDITAAAERGRALVAAAEAEAARMLQAAQACVRDADQHYTELYSAATAAGWAPTDLTALGFPPGDNPAPRRRRPIAAAPHQTQTSTTAPSADPTAHPTGIPEQAQPA